MKREFQANIIKMDKKEELIEVIQEWVMNQIHHDLDYDESLFTNIMDFKLEKKDASSASEEQLEEVSQWMEDNQGEFEYFLDGDNDFDSDLALEIYEEAMDKV